MWDNVHDLVLLGNTAVSRLPIFSFVIRHPISGVLLHHNYVCALLNDLFGIQARGGCACAGPYAQNLLGINEALAKEIENLLLEDSRLDRVHLRRYNEYSEREILRPGFVRLNLPYFMSEDAVDFVLKAVKMVAEHGWKLLPQYMFNPETGEWKHRTHQVFRDRKWLSSISYAEGHMTYPSSPSIGQEVPSSFTQCLQKAEELFERASADRSVHSVGDQTLLLGEEGEKLRWFLLPSEAALLLRGKQLTYFPLTSPFTPLQWKDGLRLSQGNDLARTQCAEHSQRTSKCTTRVTHFNEKTAIFAGNVKKRNSNETSEHSYVANGDNGIKEFSCNGEKFDKDQKRHCFASQDMSENQHTNPVFEEALCLVSNECRPLKMAKENSDVARKGRYPGKDQTPNGKCLAELTDVASVFATEQVLTNVGNEDMNLSFDKHGGVSDFDVNQTSNEGRSDEQKCKDYFDDITNAKVACERNYKAKVISGKPQFHHPPKCIFKPTTQAIEEYEMIRDGDRVLVCLSGGKDSLSLLHTLRQYQFYSKSKGIKFEIGAATVDPQSSGYDPRPLVPYLGTLEVPYFFEEQGIIQQAAKLPVCESICSFCSRMKRGRLYACARREGYNVLAMGQHLDDLAESFLMSAFHNGLLRTMKANYTVMEGDLRVIRPFVYVREKELRTFAEKVKLPVITENCPACFEAPKERHRTKQLLAAQEILFPGLYNSLLTAMKPLMSRDRVGLESSMMRKGNYEYFL